MAAVVEGDVKEEEELVTAQIADTQDTHLPPVEAMEPAVTSAAVAGVHPTLSRPTMRKYALSYEFTEYVPHFFQYHTVLYLIHSPTIILLPLVGATTMLRRKINFSTFQYRPS